MVYFAILGPKEHFRSSQKKLFENLHQSKKSQIVFFFLQRRASLTQFESGLVGAIALLTHLRRQINPNAGEMSKRKLS